MEFSRQPFLPLENATFPNAGRENKGVETEDDIFSFHYNSIPADHSRLDLVDDSVLSNDEEADPSSIDPTLEIITVPIRSSNSTVSDALFGALALPASDPDIWNTDHEGWEFPAAFVPITENSQGLVLPTGEIDGEVVPGAQAQHHSLYMQPASALSSTDTTAYDATLSSAALSLPFTLSTPEPIEPVLPSPYDEHGRAHELALPQASYTEYTSFSLPLQTGGLDLQAHSFAHVDPNQYHGFLPTPDHDGIDILSTPALSDNTSQSLPTTVMANLDEHRHPQAMRPVAVPREYSGPTPQALPAGPTSLSSLAASGLGFAPCLPPMGMQAAIGGPPASDIPKQLPFVFEDPTLAEAARGGARSREQVGPSKDSSGPPAATNRTQFQFESAPFLYHRPPACSPTDGLTCGEAGSSKLPNGAGGKARKRRRIEGCDTVGRHPGQADTLEPALHPTASTEDDSAVQPYAGIDPKDTAFGKAVFEVEKLNLPKIGGSGPLRKLVLLGEGLTYGLGSLDQPIGAKYECILERDDGTLCGKKCPMVVENIRKHIARHFSSQSMVICKCGYDKQDLTAMKRHTLDAYTSLTKVCCGICNSTRPRWENSNIVRHIRSNMHIENMCKEAPAVWIKKLD